MDKLTIKIALAAFAISFVVFQVGYRTGIEQGTSTEWVEYTVRSGDTLWDIAKENKPVTYGYEKWIYEVTEQNNCSANIKPGQVIRILVNKE